MDDTTLKFANGSLKEARWREFATAALTGRASVAVGLTDEHELDHATRVSRQAARIADAMMAEWKARHA